MSIPTVTRREIEVYCEEWHGGGYRVPLHETEDGEAVAHHYFDSDPVAIQAVESLNGKVVKVYDREVE